MIEAAILPTPLPFLLSEGEDSLAKGGDGVQGKKKEKKEKEGKWKRWTGSSPLRRTSLRS